MLLGAGGAARAVAYGLREAGAAVDVIARRPERVAWAPARPWTGEELREAFAGADLVVDCTPAALGGGGEERGVRRRAPARRARARRRGSSTLVYHRRTILLERARARGHSTVDGRAMLVHQGARAFAIWTGRPAPIEAMTRALDDALRGT